MIGCEYKEFKTYIKHFENNLSGLEFKGQIFIISVMGTIPGVNGIYAEFDIAKPPMEFPSPIDKSSYEFVGYKYRDNSLIYSGHLAWLDTNNNKLVFENLFNDDSLIRVYPEKVVYRNQKSIKKETI